MAKSFFVLWACFSACMFFSCGPKERVIDYPEYEVKNTTGLEIVRVVMNDTSTVVDAEAYTYPGGWIRLDSSMYVQADGQRYAIRSSEGLPMNKRYVMPDSGKCCFKMVFPPLPRGTKKMDIIEGRMNLGGWHVWGLHLDASDEISPSAIWLDMEKREWKEATVLPPAELRMGRTKVRVKLSDYRELMDGREIHLVVNDLFNEGKELSAKIDKNNSCTFEFDQYSTGWISVSNELFHTVVVVAPGDDVEVYVDLQEATRRTSRYLKTERTPSPVAYVVGNSEYISLNNAIQREAEEVELFPRSFREDIVGMNADEYTGLVMKYYRAAMDGLSANESMATGLKRYLEIGFKGMAAQMICRGQGVLEDAYRVANDIEWDGVLTGYEVPVFTDEHFSALAELGLNQKDMLYAQEFQWCCNCIFHQLPTLERLENVVGVKEGFLVDCFKLRGIYSQVENMVPLTREQRENMASIDPYYTQAYEHAKGVMEAKAVGYVKKLGERIREVPDVVNSKLFDAIVKRYRGKVVFVDFWATWCGPCRGSIAQFEPRKKRFANDDVVFVYITGESSPRGKWLEMISDIQGEHYRLSGKQWKYVCDQFGIDGIPSYVVVDKHGKAALRNDFRAKGIEEGLRQELKK